MDTFDSAKIKDDILKFLSGREQQQSNLRSIIKELKLSHIPVNVMIQYTEEMEQDDAIKRHEFSGSGSLIVLRPNGEKILFDGGYLAKYNQESQVKAQTMADDELNRTKTKFEIKSLRIQTWVSIIAIIISMAAILISIFYD